MSAQLYGTALPSALPSARESARDALCALILAVLALVLYWSSPRLWLWGDGDFLLARFAEGRSTWMHLAYLPTARVLEWLGLVEGPAPALRAAASLGAAVGLGFSFLLARRAGVGRSAAGFATAMIGLTPAVWFFAVQVEVHGTQFAAVALGAWLTAAAPWARFGPALGSAMVGLALVHFGHQSAPALGPGWVLLVAFAARRQGVILSAPRVLFAVGPALVVALVCADFAITLVGEPAVLFGSKERVATFAAEHHNLPSLAWWRADIVLPLGAAVLGVLLGIAALVRRGRAGALEAAALAALIGVPTAIFALWAVDNRGGYLAASAPFLIWLVGRSPDLWRRRSTGVLLLVGLVLSQAMLGWRDLAGEADNFDRAKHERRAAAVAAALPHGGYLLSLDIDQQNVRQFAARVGEVFWVNAIERSRRRDEDPAATARRLVDEVRTQRAGSALLLDVDYRQYLELPGFEPWGARARAIEIELGRHFRFEPVAGPEGSDWPLVRLVP